MRIGDWAVHESPELQVDKAVGVRDLDRLADDGLQSCSLDDVAWFECVCRLGSGHAFPLSSFVAACVVRDDADVNVIAWVNYVIYTDKSVLLSRLNRQICSFVARWRHGCATPGPFDAGGRRALLCARPACRRYRRDHREIRRGESDVVRPLSDEGRSHRCLSSAEKRRLAPAS